MEHFIFLKNCYKKWCEDKLDQKLEYRECKMFIQMNSKFRIYKMQNIYNATNSAFEGGSVTIRRRNLISPV